MLCIVLYCKIKCLGNIFTTCNVNIERKRISYQIGVVLVLSVAVQNLPYQVKVNSFFYKTKNARVYNKSSGPILNLLQQETLHVICVEIFFTAFQYISYLHKIS